MAPISGKKRADACADVMSVSARVSPCPSVSLVVSDAGKRPNNLSSGSWEIRARAQCDVLGDSYRTLCMMYIQSQCDSYYIQRAPVLARWFLFRSDATVTLSRTRRFLEPGPCPDQTVPPPVGRSLSSQSDGPCHLGQTVPVVPVKRSLSFRSDGPCRPGQTGPHYSRSNGPCHPGQTVPAIPVRRSLPSRSDGPCRPGQTGPHYSRSNGPCHPGQTVPAIPVRRSLPSRSDGPCRPGQTVSLVPVRRSLPSRSDVPAIPVRWSLSSRSDGSSLLPVKRLRAGSVVTARHGRRSALFLRRVRRAAPHCATLSTDSAPNATHNAASRVAAPFFVPDWHCSGRLKPSQARRFRGRSGKVTRGRAGRWGDSISGRMKSLVCSSFRKIGTVWLGSGQWTRPVEIGKSTILCYIICYAMLHAAMLLYIPHALLVLCYNVISFLARAILKSTLDVMFLLFCSFCLYICCLYICCLFALHK